MSLWWNRVFLALKKENAHEVFAPPKSQSVSGWIFPAMLKMNILPFHILPRLQGLLTDWKTCTKSLECRAGIKVQVSQSAFQKYHI